MPVSGCRTWVDEMTEKYSTVLLFYFYGFEALSTCLARRDRDRLGTGCAGDSPAQLVLASCASTSDGGGILGMRV